MVDSATARFGARKQSLGSNVNTWGDTKLNDVLDLFDRGAKGYQSVVITGDTTLNWTSYATANQGQVQTLKLTGSLSAPANVVIPSREWAFTVINAAGHTVTVKTAAGSGVAVPTGYQAALYCDGSDVGNAAPSVIAASLKVAGAVDVGGRITNLDPATANTDAVNKAQMDNAIALATTSTSPGTLRITASDTTAKFLDGAISVSSALSKTIVNPGAAETLALDIPAYAALTGQRTDVASGTTAAVAFTRYRFTGAATITLPSFAVGEFIIVEFGAATGTTQTVARNAQTIDGAAEDDTSLRFGDVLAYRCVSAGAVLTQHIALLPT